MSFLQLVLSLDKTKEEIILFWRICQFDRYRNNDFESWPKALENPTLPNLNSEVSKPQILLFSYWFFMQIGWTAFTA